MVLLVPLFADFRGRMVCMRVFMMTPSRVEVLTESVSKSNLFYFVSGRRVCGSDFNNASALVRLLFQYPTDVI